MKEHLKLNMSSFNSGVIWRREKLPKIHNIEQDIQKIETRFRNHVCLLNLSAY